MRAAVIIRSLGSGPASGVLKLPCREGYLFRSNLAARYGADMARFRGAYPYVGVAMSY